MDKNYQQDLEHIRKMMERSSRFMSLSGLSGVFAGITALAGAVYVNWYLKQNFIDYLDGGPILINMRIQQHLLLTGMVVLFVALFSGYFFTARKSKKSGQRMWDITTKRLLLNFAIPLVVGGVFCLGLIYNGLFAMVAPVTLIFYGLALIHSSKYTLSDIQNLGYCEVVLGLISLFFLGWGLVFWSVGFGILHIVYGIMMYKKYD